MEDLGDVTADEIDRTQLVGEIGFKYKGFSMFSEYYWRKRTGVGNANLIDQGFFAQTGYFLIPKKLEVAGRYSLVDFDDELEADVVREATFGINYYLQEAHNHKLQFNVVRIDEENPESDNIDYKYILQYQMAF